MWQCQRMALVKCVYWGWRTWLACTKPRHELHEHLRDELEHQCLTSVPEKIPAVMFQQSSGKPSASVSQLLLWWKIYQQSKSVIYYWGNLRTLYGDIFMNDIRCMYCSKVQLVSIFKLFLNNLNRIQKNNIVKYYYDLT